MAVQGLIHIILFGIEDLIIYLGAKAGISFWAIVGISLLMFYFFYPQIYAFVRAILRWVGI